MDYIEALNLSLSVLSRGINILTAYFYFGGNSTVLLFTVIFHYNILHQNILKSFKNKTLKLY